MKLHTHHYETTITWTGNDGEGTATYRSYRRDHDVDADGLPTIAGSADRTFRGDPSRWNPEQLLVAALAQCHLLTYLHLAAGNDITVVAYTDRATGSMQTHADGSGEFVEVTLRPHVTITDSAQVELARELHDRAEHLCFIARSVNFPVHHEPQITVGPGGAGTLP